jgi:hypothetical protein
VARQWPGLLAAFRGGRRSHTTRHNTAMLESMRITRHSTIHVSYLGNISHVGSRLQGLTTRALQLLRS